MNNSNWYPGGMPPYQQPYGPYQQSYQQQGYQQPHPHMQPVPPSPMIPQPGVILNADGRPQQQASPTRMQAPYMSGGLPTAPPPGYQYHHPGGPYVTPPPPPLPLPPQNHIYHNIPSSVASQGHHSDSNFGSTYSDPNVNPSPQPSPRAFPIPPPIVPIYTHVPSPHPSPQRSPHLPKYDSQADQQARPEANSHRQRPRSRSRARSVHHRSASESHPKSILKQPKSQPEPEPQSEPAPQTEPSPSPSSESHPNVKPKPKPKNHHHRHTTHSQESMSHHPPNPLAPPLSSKQDILTRGRAELAPLARSVLEVVVYEFALPASSQVDVSFSVGAIDIAPENMASQTWSLGTGVLHALTGLRVLAPILTITLPPAPQPALPLPPRSGLAEVVPQPDHGVIAACERVVAALRYGAPYPPPPPPTPANVQFQAPPSPHMPTIPFRVGGELFGCSYVFRLGPADRTTVLGALTWVYLPQAGRVGLAPAYERVEKDGREGNRRLRRWARDWDVVRDLPEHFGRNRREA